MDTERERETGNEEGEYDVLGRSATVETHRSIGEREGI